MIDDGMTDLSLVVCAVRSEECGSLCMVCKADYVF